MITLNPGYYVAILFISDLISGCKLCLLSLYSLSKLFYYAYCSTSNCLLILSIEISTKKIIY